MKRMLAALLSIVLLLGLTACQADTPAPPAAAGNAKKSSTLLVYMVGSDLESKAGAGTKDLEEMLESGIDLSKNNVLVYTGGAKKWHNDYTTKDACHVLELTKDGFTSVTTMPSASMGESDSLSGFLNYAYENYKSDSYALVMWNHGDGPVIGYGKDMLYDNDSLTLQEMRTALEASPFGGDNKLAWVGFDACLMASAELACVWADYAKYLVASQEVEPSFGWNYSFLSQLPAGDTPALLADIAADYLDTCEAYYKKKGYDDRDTTLSCMDLSGAAALEEAVNALFTAAKADVSVAYNELTASRANTRALGRASTGSEYDLIDLKDMASQLAQRYPKEAEQLTAAIEGMVLTNQTNTEGCCGMSLYYPFYNKTYYEKDWSEIYTQLGIFPAYLDYLNAYAAQWLGNDLLAEVAKSTRPSAVNKETFALGLTAEQADAYASAHYYILQKEGEGLYTALYASSAVTKDGDRLIADFDGDVLYAKTGLGRYFLPVTVEHDTVGSITRYSAYVNLTNDLGILLDYPADYKHQVAGHRFHLAADTETKEIGVSALVPYDMKMDAGTLTGGKAEDADLSQWTTYYFLQQRHRYVTYYANGTVRPLEEWDASSYYSANTSPIADGLEFVFAPLPEGEYYLIFEIEDTQGNRYCSDFLPITTGGQLESAPSAAPIETTWTDGDKVKLLEQDGVTIHLTTAEDYDGVGYALEIHNSNDFDVAVKGDWLFINDAIYCGDGSVAYVRVPAGETVVEDSFDFGDAATACGLTAPTSLQFGLTVQDYRTCKTLVYRQPFAVTLSAKTALPFTGGWLAEYDVYDTPCRGALATQQTVSTVEGATVTLLGLGSNGKDTSLRGAVQIDNPTDRTVHLAVDGYVLNGVHFAGGATVEIPAKSTVYHQLYVAEDDLEIGMVASISQVQLVLRTAQFATLEGGGGFSQVYTCPVKLQQSGSPAAFTEGETLLYSGNGLRICLKSDVESPYEDSWYLTVVNTGSIGVNLDVTDVVINGKSIDNDQTFVLGVVDGKLGAGQRCVCRLAYYGDDPLTDLSFKLRVLDYTAETVLFTTEEAISLEK